MGNWIAADYAYVCYESITTPHISECAIARSTGDAFTFYQSSICVYIERAFGILTAHCGKYTVEILKLILPRNFQTIRLAMYLHRFCVECSNYSSRSLMTSAYYESEESYVSSLMPSSDSIRRSYKLQGLRTRTEQPEPREELLHTVTEQVLVHLL